MSFARFLRLALASLCVLALVPAAMAGPPRFTTIDYPGAVATVLGGINPEGYIVGGYYDSDWNEHGFVLLHGRFVSFDYPNALWTEAEGISPQGVIVGQYGLPDNTVHGFLLRGGHFQPVDVPGPTNEGLANTMPVHISPDGTIVGCYHQSAADGSVKLDTMYGFALNGDRITWFPLNRSMNNGVNRAGDIAGIYFDPADNGRVRQSYVVSNGVTTWFSFPGSVATQAWDISPTGAVVGFHRNASGIHGFVRQGEKMTSFDVPGASETRAFGVNAAGSIVGYYVDATGYHGFLRSRIGVNFDQDDR